MACMYQAEEVTHINRLSSTCIPTTDAAFLVKAGDRLADANLILPVLLFNGYHRYRERNPQHAIEYLT
jgi:hypothetical protein